MKRFIIILFLLCGLVGKAQDKNYYVSQTDGDDGDSGLTPALAWKTITKLEDVTFQPDDSIFFNRGDEWKESFEPKGSGTKNNKIVITAYGSGEKPIITGRDTISGWSLTASWTESSSNVWYITVGSLVSKFRIWINGTEQRKAEYVTLIDATDTFADSAEIDRLYLYCVGNPASVYSGGLIESGWVRSTPLYFNTVNHYEVDHLDIRGGYYSVRLRASDGIIIDNCDIGNSSTQFGLLGERIADPVNQSDSCVVRNCLFDTDNSLSSDWEVKYTENGLEVYGGNDWDIFGNTFKNWGHASIYILTGTTATNHRINIYDNYMTAPDISYGRGLNVDCIGSNCQDLKIYRNLIKDTPTTNQINNYGTEFYYNIINNVTDVSFRPGYGAGILISGYGGNTLPQGMKFYNNVFANCNDQGIYMSWYAGRNSQHDNEFVNNIFYNNNGYAIHVMSSDSIYNNTFKNNIAYDYRGNDLIYYRGLLLRVSAFNSADNKGDIISDNNGDSPIFKTGTFEPSVLSTNVINKGLDVGLASDYKENPIVGLPEIGAYEWYEGITVSGEVFGISSDSTFFLKNSNEQFLIYSK